MIEKRKTVVVITVIIAVLSFAAVSQGQEEAPAVKVKGGMGYSIFGKSTIDIGSMNDKLESHGYTRLSENYFCVGGGGHSIIKNRWIIGGEGYSLLGDDVTSDNFNASTYVFQGFANIGYIVLSKKGFSVYPLIGLGGGSMRLTFTEEGASYSVDEVLTDPKQCAQLTAGGFLINLALGVDYYLKLGENEEGHGGFLLGVRAGYTLQTSQSGWEIYDNELFGAPGTSMTGPFVRIIFGGGGYEKED
ncbi:hypothetical protein JW835_06000 [bacterium]|nr:hypothetical protein [bacterium]